MTSQDNASSVFGNEGQDTPPSVAGLIERLEQASEGSGELDALVLAAVVGATAAQSPLNGRWCVYDGADRNGKPRLYESREKWWNEMRRAYIDDRGPTRSLDTALTLVPKGWWAEIYARPDQPSCRLYEFSMLCRKVPEPPYVIVGASTAIAVCCAALQARAVVASPHTVVGTPGDTSNTDET